MRNGTWIGTDEQYRLTNLSKLNSKRTRCRGLPHAALSSAEYPFERFLHGELSSPESFLPGPGYSGGWAQAAPPSLFRVLSKIYAKSPKIIPTFLRISSKCKLNYEILAFGFKSGWTAI